MNKKKTGAQKSFNIKSFFSSFFKSKKNIVITTLVLSFFVIIGIASFAGTNNSGRKYIELQSVYMSGRDVASRNSSKNGRWEDVTISKCQITTYTGDSTGVDTYVDGTCGSNYGGTSTESTGPDKTWLTADGNSKYYQTVNNQKTGQRVWKPTKEDKKKGFDVNYFNNFMPTEYISNQNLVYTIKGTSKGDSTNLVINAKDCAKTKLPIGSDEGSLKPGNSYTITVSYNDPEVKGTISYPNTNKASIRIGSDGKISGRDAMSVQGLVRFAVSYDKVNNKPAGCRRLKDADRFWAKGGATTDLAGKFVYSQDFFNVTFVEAQNSCTMIGGRIPSVKEIKSIINDDVEGLSYGDDLIAGSYWTEEGMMYKKGDVKPRYKTTLNSTELGSDNQAAYNAALGQAPVKKAGEVESEFLKRQAEYQKWLVVVARVLAEKGDIHPTIGNDHFGTYPSLQSRFSTRLLKNNVRCVKDPKTVNTPAPVPVPSATTPAPAVTAPTTTYSDGSGGEFWKVKCISGQEVKGTPNGCLANQTQITDGVTPVPMFGNIMAGYLIVNTYSTNGQVQYEWSYQTDAAGNYSAPKLVTNVVNDGMDNLLGQPYQGKSYRYKIIWWVKGKESERKEYIIEKVLAQS